MTGIARRPMITEITRRTGFTGMTVVTWTTGILKQTRIIRMTKMTWMSTKVVEMTRVTGITEITRMTAGRIRETMLTCKTGMTVMESIERFSYDLEMRMHKQNRNKKQTKIERS